MASKEQIIKEIELHTRDKILYKILIGSKAWYIGVTEYPKERKMKHKHPDKWRMWKTSSANVARSIERHFLDKGFKGSHGGGKNTLYVYVY